MYYNGGITLKSIDIAGYNGYDCLCMYVSGVIKILIQEEREKII